MNEQTNCTDATFSTNSSDGADSTGSAKDSTAQEYTRFFPELNLSLEEDDFLHDVVVARIEFHERHALHTVNKRIPQEDLEMFCKAGQALEALMERLPHEDCLIINRYCDSINTQHAFEVDDYYKDGLLDGVRLARLFQKA